MTLNKTKIEWCDRTWNPVTGCLHGCSYCYARKIAERFRGTKAWPNGFEPTYHPERLCDPEKTREPQSIFVCSVADLFGEWVPRLWTDQVFCQTIGAGHHEYIFLTKNPPNMKKLFLDFMGTIPNENYSFLTMPYSWFGTTVTGSEDVHRIRDLQEFPHPHRLVSFEPLLSNPGKLNLIGIRQVIIGAQTNPFDPPQMSWILNIVNAARKAGALIFMKDSLKSMMCNMINVPIFPRELCWKVRK